MQPQLQVACMAACESCKYAVAFLEGVSTALAETNQPRLEQPVLFLSMHVAQYQLATGDVDACKAAVSGAKEELDRLHDVRMCTLVSCLDMLRCL